MTTLTIRLPDDTAERLNPDCPLGRGMMARRLARQFGRG